MPIIIIWPWRRVALFTRGGVRSGIRRGIRIRALWTFRNLRAGIYRMLRVALRIVLRWILKARFIRGVGVVRRRIKGNLDMEILRIFLNLKKLSSFEIKKLKKLPVVNFTQ